MKNFCLILLEFFSAMVFSCGARIGNSGDVDNARLTLEAVVINRDFKSLQLGLTGIDLGSAQEGYAGIEPSEPLMRFDGPSERVGLLSQVEVPPGDYSSIDLNIDSSASNRLESYAGERFNLLMSGDDSNFSIPYEFSAASARKDIHLILVIDAAAAIELTAGNQFRLLPTADILASDSAFVIKSTENVRGVTACLYVASALPAEPDDCKTAVQRTEVIDGTYLFTYVPAGAYVVRVYADENEFTDFQHEVSAQAGTPQVSASDPDSQSDDSDDPPAVTEEEKISLQNSFSAGLKLTINKAGNLAKSCAYPEGTPQADISLLATNASAIRDAIKAVEVTWTDSDQETCAKQVGVAEMALSYRQCKGIKSTDVREIMTLAALETLEIGDKAVRGRLAKLTRWVWLSNCTESEAAD